MSALRTLAWLIAIVYSTIPSYWLLVHPRAQRWAQGGGKRLMAVGPAWVLMWVVLGVVSAPVRHDTLYNTRWAWLPAMVLIMTGIAIYGFARQNFSTDQVLGRAELQPDRHEQRLIATGIRARIRHPYYLGHLCELVGWTVGSGLVVAYSLLGLAIVTGYAMVRAEEHELEQRFGEQYRQYRTTSCAMFPGIW